MAKTLPPEILFHIADYLNSPDCVVALPKYALVCRQWQAVFEPLIYKTLCVHSSSFRTGKGTISLSHFESLVSGSQHRIARRGMIQDIKYTVIVPYDLPDYKSSIIRDHPGGYTRDNPIRHANDEAFHDGVVDLFNILTSWKERHCLGISPRILGREQQYEPGTEFCPSAREYAEIPRGNKWVVRPYRARFPEDKSNLPDVSCIHQLIFEDYGNEDETSHIWPGTALSIARSCPMLHEFYWHTFDFIRPDHLDYMQERRQALAEGLTNLPSTLRMFDYHGLSEQAYHDSGSAPILIQGNLDLFSVNLRPITLCLQELNLAGIAVSLDFLLPLDQDGKPIALCMEWPSLKRIKIETTNYLPSGEWFFDPTPEEDESNTIAHFNDSASEDSYDTQLVVLEEIPYERSELRVEMCHRAYISLGYAAQHMPRLTSIEYLLPLQPGTEFRFSKDQVSGNATITWETGSMYEPDKRVAEAWGYQLDDMEFLVKDPPMWPTVRLPCWPPL
ncbi:hypothetical protein BDW59DRAFT_154852, partial [Aspergillus cavernicola]